VRELRECVVERLARAARNAGLAAREDDLEGGWGRESSSNPGGGGGGASIDTRGDLGCDLDRDRGFEIEIPKILILRHRLAGTLTPELSGCLIGEGTGMQDGGCLLTFGVPTVAVVTVIVAEFMGRDGILYGGFEPKFSFVRPFCGTLDIGQGADMLVWGRERDLERVRIL